ncbi:MAG: hypothetical protein ACXWDI_09455 [Nocardioides sp.]
MARVDQHGLAAHRAAERTGEDASAIPQVEPFGQRAVGPAGVPGDLVIEPAGQVLKQAGLTAGPRHLVVLRADETDAVVGDGGHVLSCGDHLHERVADVQAQRELVDPRCADSL